MKLINNALSLLLGTGIVQNPSFSCSPQRISNTQLTFGLLNFMVLTIAGMSYLQPIRMEILFRLMLTCTAIGLVRCASSDVCTGGL